LGHGAFRRMAVIFKGMNRFLTQRRRLPLSLIFGKQDKCGDADQMCIDRRVLNAACCRAMGTYIFHTPRN
ncbi:MAG: hypothetical protein KKA41_09230, partial [Proteobacteria bacterium]|nr:hypothetical protein [Pseudomonadota bacterium]